MRDEVQQVAGQLARRIDAEAGLAGVGQALDLALDLADGLLQLRAGLEGLGAQLFDNVEGDYFTILGLPLLPLLGELRSRGILAS